MEATIILFIMFIVFGLGFWMLSKEIFDLHRTLHNDLNRVEKKLEETYFRMLK